MLSLVVCLRILKGLDEISDSDLVEQHFPESMVELEDMVKCAADTASESFVLCAVEAADEGHESIDLGKLQAHFLGLCSDVFNRLATVNTHNFVLALALQDFEERVD